MIIDNYKTDIVAQICSKLNRKNYVNVYVGKFVFKLGKSEIADPKIENSTIKKEFNFDGSSNSFFYIYDYFVILPMFRCNINFNSTSLPNPACLCHHEENRCLRRRSILSNRHYTVDIWKVSSKTL